MEYTYFVSFSHQQGFGSCQVILNQKVDSLEGYNTLNDFVKEQNKNVAKQVVVINYILIKERLDE